MANLLNDFNHIFLNLSCREYRGTDTHELFSQFYQKDIQGIRNWVVKAFQTEHNNKNDIESDTFRKEGNKFYVNGQWTKSLKCYTQALSKACEDSELYAIALANRSAVLYSMEKYEHCLIDIDRCLECTYPDHLRYKVYIRKIYCYDKLGTSDNAENSLREGVMFITNNIKFTTIEKELYINKLLEVKRISRQNTTVSENYKSKIPNYVENEVFLGASSLIGLRYSSEKGRYVVTETDVKTGDILFVEKAYIFAPIFNENFELSVDKCYYCLLGNSPLIPCFSCSVSLYCNNDCRMKSWNEFHKWECKGMHVNLWSTISLGFPAFRLLLRGVPSKFNMKGNNEQNRISNFGSKKYAYNVAYELCMDISNNKNMVEFLLLAAIVVCYLETQTTFYKWLSDQINMENNEDLKIFIGGLLLRHILQFACNASVIEHWRTNNCKYIPLESTPVAAGLYPSVSMMNHSCKPNVSMYYVNDVVIVKAVDCLKKNDEVFNCYGVDYRDAKKEERQSTLEMRYQFQCSCEICKNPKLEMAYLDTFRCEHCTGSVSLEQLKCYDCGQLNDVSKNLSLEKEVKQYLERKSLYLEDINKCFDITKKIYSSRHARLLECYDLFIIYYFQTGQFEKAIECFNKSLEIKKKRLGKYSWRIAKETINFLDQLKMRNVVATTNNKKRLLRSIEDLYVHTKKILPLSYPDNIINDDVLKQLLQQ